MAAQSGRRIESEVAEQQMPAIVVTPAFQEVTLEASQSGQTTTITVFNQTNQSQEFEIFAVSVNQVDAEGRAVLSDRPLNPLENAAPGFIRLAESVVSIQPQQQAVIPVVITNSVDMSPGGHYVSLLIKNKLGSIASQSAVPSVLPAISSFLLIRKLGGEQYNLSLRSVSLERQSFWTSLPETAYLTFENQGNIHTTPRGIIAITDVFGRVTVEGTVNEGSQIVLPRSQRTQSVPLRQIRPSLPIMMYKMTVSGSSEPGNIGYAQISYALYVRRSLLYILPTMLAIVLAAFYYQRHRKHSAA